MDFLDRIIKYSLYLLVFLIPVFFLPWTVSPIFLNKQMLLAVFVFLLLISWLVKIIISGKLNYVWNKLSFAVLLLILILGVSTFFSLNQNQSLFGVQDEPDTFFVFILLALVFFLFSQLPLLIEISFEKLIFAFLTSASVLSSIFLVQVFLQRPLFPWNFANFIGFNPIGSVEGLAIFSGAAFLMLLALFNNRKIKEIKIKGLLILLGVLLFLTVFLVNYWVVWLGIIFGLAIILWSSLRNLSSANENEYKKFILPLFIFVLALLMIFIKIPFGKILQLPSDITPTYQATFNISQQTLEESSKNLLLGSGPATFEHQYTLHRSAGPNLTDFWQIRFNQGTSSFLTFLGTFGILGFLSFLSIIAVFLYQGLKSLKEKTNPLKLALFIAAIYFFISWSFYPFILSLSFAGFLVMGLWLALDGKAKQFSFAKSPQKAFFTMFLAMILMAGSVFGIYNISKNYAAAIIYEQGFNLANNQQSNLDEIINKIFQAAELNPKDFYFRELSQLFILKINQIVNNQELSSEQKQQELQRNVSNVETAANNAIQFNPKNSQNWFNSGTVYESFALLGLEGAEELSSANYQKAAELDPQNPQIPFNIGRVFKTTAEKIKAEAEQGGEEKKEELNKNLDEAIKYFNKTIELKPNLAVAYYLLAQTYELKGEKEKALVNYQIILQLDPTNEEIKKKIEELSH